MAEEDKNMKRNSASQEKSSSEPQSQLQPQPQPKDEKDELREKLTAAEKQRDEYLAGWQRAKADFINYKKEEFAHLEEVARYGSEDLIKDLISVLDDFDLALRIKARQNSTQPNPQAEGIEEGIPLIYSKLKDVLKKRGLLEIPLKVGDSFDPALTEAMMEIDSDKPAGTIVDIVQMGYRLSDKILRPARVIVSKGKQIEP